MVFDQNDRNFTDFPPSTNKNWIIIYCQCGKSGYAHFVVFCTIWKSGITLEDKRNYMQNLFYRHLDRSVSRGRPTVTADPDSNLDTYGMHGRIARWCKWRACDVGKRKKGWTMICDWRMSRSHSPTLPSLHLHHSSFSNLSVGLPTSQLILQPFRCTTYVTTHSPTLVSLFLRHRLFIYITWRATHDGMTILNEIKKVIPSIFSPFQLPYFIILYPISKILPYTWWAAEIQ